MRRALVVALRVLVGVVVFPLAWLAIAILIAIDLLAEFAKFVIAPRRKSSW